MALIECKECKEEISSKAKACPHCGAKKYNPRYFLKGLMLFVAFIIFKGATYDGSDIQGKDPKDYVLSVCRDFIKKKAHNPSSVKFGRDYPSPTIVAPNIYSMTLPLRAENGFGAIRQFSAKCTVRYDKGSFYLVGIEQLDQ